MLFATPPAEPFRARLAALDDLHRQLGAQAGTSAPWLGSLRRQFRASSAESSISIEGFSVPGAEAAALVAGSTPPGAADGSRGALIGSARALEHLAVMAGDPAFRWLDRVILDLHFDACSFQRDQRPGLWRTGPIGVTHPSGSGLAFVGPEADEVPGLMAEVVDWLQDGDRDAHVVVRAAMAHLHTISVHPFRDGNGRLARIVQSLVLARDGILAPELGSIEEYLGRHTPAYYAALQEAQGGRYDPARDASGWVSFCVDAHLDQARRRLAQIAQAGERWARLEELVAARNWPDRLVIALEQCLVHGADRASYAREAGVSPATASADIRRLLDAGLIDQRGRGPGTRYHASATLRDRL